MIEQLLKEIYTRINANKFDAVIKEARRIRNNDLTKESK